jgi:dTDP-4-amino-4,6-dideoxygalactose transaminase
MNINPSSIERAIGPRTRAVISINYGGIPCDYGKIIPLCEKHGLILIEDNAHGLFSKYNDLALGSFGDIACFSFDHLKNISCFEGGAILFKDERYVKTYLEIAELGTNRLEWSIGKVANYEWVTVGTNSRLAEPLRVILHHQLVSHKDILCSFQSSWNQYQAIIEDLAVPIVCSSLPANTIHNGYLFWVRTENILEAQELVRHMEIRGIDVRFHYTPLHSSNYGKQVGIIRVPMDNTERLASTLIRLPLFYSIKNEQIEHVCLSLSDFFKDSNPA